MSKLPKLPPPTPGKTPDMRGVPGEIVSLDGLDLAFGRSVKSSPYDVLLNQLVEAGQGKALRFDDVRAKASLYARSKKLGLRISFAVLGTTLYVRLDGRVDDDIKVTRRSWILAGLNNGPRVAGELLNIIRDKGDVTIDLPTVEAILAQMFRSGDLVKQDGGKYIKNPRVRT